MSTPKDYYPLLSPKSLSEFYADEYAAYVKSLYSGPPPKAELVAKADKPVKAKKVRKKKCSPQKT